MPTYALLDGALGRHAGRTAVVAATDAKVAHAAMAAAGVKAVVVGAAAPANYVLVSNAESPVVRAGVAAAIKYDGQVLAQLYPGAVVLVGSLRKLMPRVNWVADPGGMVVRVPGPRAVLAAAVVEKKAEVTLARASDPRPLTIKVRLLPRPPLGVRGPVMRAVLDGPNIRGVPLKAGDVVVDVEGRRWFYRNNALWSHKTATLERAQVRVEGRTVRPVRAGTRLPGVERGDRVELTLLGSDDGALYGVLTDGDPDLWTFTTDVDYSIVTDPMATCFGARLAKTPAACQAAGGIWDRPCRIDLECPYYDKRTGRGRCMSGTCEMPLKVANKSFRVADPDTPPMYESDASPFDVPRPGAPPLFRD